MNKIKIKLFFLCLLFVLNKIDAQQSFGVMSDSTITNFIEEELIEAYGYLDVLADYRDSTFKRTLKIYQKAGWRCQRYIGGGCLSKEEMEKISKHLQYLEETIIARDKKLENLIEDGKTRLIELTLEKYTSRIGREKRLSLILNKDKIWYVGEEVFDVTKDLIKLLQREQEEIEELFEIEMKSSKNEFQKIVSNEKEVR